MLIKSNSIRLNKSEFKCKFWLLNIIQANTKTIQKLELRKGEKENIELRKLSSITIFKT